MANVVLEGVSKTFEAGVSAVRNLDLEIADREFMVLVGPSGCGKSTTLRMVAGLESPTAGKIRIGDRVVNQVPPKDRDIAMVFQNYALYPHMSVYKNMAFGLQLRYGGNWLTRRWRRWRDPETARQSELRRSEIKDRVRQAATMLGIDQLLDRMPGQLSGGERQRVALGRALVRDPEAFLFDEPLSNLDAKLRVGMRREIKQLHARLETTMIYVTHDQTEALTLGDRIAVLDEGQLQQVGRPLELYDQPANRFVGQFIGSPPMNLLSGQLRTSPPNPTFVSGALHWRWALEGVPLEAVLARLGNHPTGNHPTGNHPTGNHPTGEVDHRQVELGVRPEDVDVAAAATGGGESAAGWIECEQPAHVQAREQLGDSTLLEIGWPNQPGRLTCKAEGRCQLQPHDQVRVRLRRERIHFFDPSTGNNLSPSS